MNNKQVDSRNLKKRNNPTRRNHDGFFRYIYSKPTNAKTLLTLAREANRELDAMLEDVNLDTLTLFPGFYNEVGEKGESDLAFTAKAYRGKDVFVGILLEHKSASDRCVQCNGKQKRPGIPLVSNQSDNNLQRKTKLGPGGGLQA